MGFYGRSVFAGRHLEMGWSDAGYIAGGEGIPAGGCGGRGRIDLRLYRRSAGNLQNAKAAVLYTVAYLYEHREEADHRGLMLTLRALLFGVRREGF